MIGVDTKTKKEFKNVFNLDLEDCSDYHIKAMIGIELFSIERFEMLVNIDLKYFFMKEASLKDKIKYSYSDKGVNLIEKILKNTKKLLKN